MGRAKAEMMEAEERGWYALDSHVCPDCVEDKYLKSLIENNCDETVCDYCGQVSEEPIAAPTEVIQEAIGSAVFFYFNDPTGAGVPWDEGAPVIEPTDTVDVLLSVGLNCNDDLFEAIADSFVSHSWVRAAGGHWLSSHPHEKLSYSWSSFIHNVKHKTRYFFSTLNSDDHSEYSPAGLLEKIAELVDELPLVSQLPVGKQLYRVRGRHNGDTWEVNAAELGPPLDEMARAGRMNPAGISYFYLAQERETALAEVLAGPPCEAACAQFLIRRELNVIDLCQVPDLPSIFDGDSRHVREALLFIDHFAETISKPVKKDGNEHIDYVPSQVVCEFFANVLRSARVEKIHGILYPSAVQPGGRNVVLFPSPDGFDTLVEYQLGEPVVFETWKEFSDAIRSKDQG